MSSPRVSRLHRPYWLRWLCIVCTIVAGVLLLRIVWLSVLHRVPVHLRPWILDGLWAVIALGTPPLCLLSILLLVLIQQHQRHRQRSTRVRRSPNSSGMSDHTSVLEGEVFHDQT